MQDILDAIKIPTDSKFAPIVNSEAFRSKLIVCLQDYDLLTEYDQIELETITEMIDCLNVFIYKDADLLAYILWKNQDICIRLLHDGYLLRKLNLMELGQKILEITPGITKTTFHGFNPIGGFTCRFTETTPYYDFINQF